MQGSGKQIGAFTCASLSLSLSARRRVFSRTPYIRALNVELAAWSHDPSLIPFITCKRVKKCKLSSVASSDQRLKAKVYLFSSFSFISPSLWFLCCCSCTLSCGTFDFSSRRVLVVFFVGFLHICNFFDFSSFFHLLDPLLLPCCCYSSFSSCETFNSSSRKKALILLHVDPLIPHQ